MKLPSLFPVAFFAGGILLSIELKKSAPLNPRILIFAALLFLAIRIHRAPPKLDSRCRAVRRGSVAIARLGRVESGTRVRLSKSCQHSDRIREAGCGNSLALARTPAQRSAAIAVGHAL